MRKIDAVLLSALLLYDYGAQSLVDSDVVSLGHSFITDNSVQETKLTDSGFSAGQLFNDNEEASTVRGIQRIKSTSSAEAEKKTISYYDLINVSAAKPETVSVAETNTLTDNNVTEETAIAAPVADAQETTYTAEDGSAPETVAVETNTINKEEATEQNASANTFFDTDADGMNDAEDKCPGVAGVARFEGCPVPDSDADGVNDEEDRCPLEKGTTASFGCPVVEPENAPVAENVSVNQEVSSAKKEMSKYANIVRFGMNSTVLSNEDFNIVMQYADILINNSNVHIELTGYADNSKTEKENQEASEIQANTLKTYLMDLGVNSNQVITTGKGSSNPIADNSTEDGRIQNQRVEVQLKY